MLTIIPIGGRVKSAGVGLDHLYPEGMDVDEAISRLRRDPPAYLRTAFFPRVGKELAQAIGGIGFFRPSLKTDQGMGGNFLPFHIDSSLACSDLGSRPIGYEEGCAIPEIWHTGVNGYANALQTAFNRLELSVTYEILEKLGTRNAEKGRRPFFLIRPALPEQPIVFGRDVMSKVQGETTALVERCVRRAYELEMEAVGLARPANILYLQPDVFISNDGMVAVERLNCPDVCFFLGGIEDPYSRVLPEVQSIVATMRDCIVERVLSTIGPNIVIVTRDEVIERQEDILEIIEIRELETALRRARATVETIPVSRAGSLRGGARLLLLNLDYRLASAGVLLRRHAAGEIKCFPNPYFQIACRDVSGLQQASLVPGEKHHDRFLAWTRSQPSDERGRADVLRQIDTVLGRNGIKSDIIHAVLETETIPVFRHSLHSWRQFHARTQRSENSGREIKFRDIPASPKKLILTSDTGPRLHGFRFMGIT